MRNRIIFAPLMIPGVSLTRFHKDIGEFEICYSAEYIHEIFSNTEITKVRTSIDHNGVEIKCKVIRSIIKGLDFESQIKRSLPFLLKEDIYKTMSDFNSFPKGSWFQVMEFEDDIALQKFIDLGRNGLSAELKHTITVNGNVITLNEKYERVDSPSDKLPYSLHINGGSTWSWGRSEHGKAHLELKVNSNGNSIDKIFIPYTSDWNKSTMKHKIELLSSQEGKINRKERKKIAEWLNSDNNLEKCHRSWNINNRYNENRVIFIF